MSFKLYGTSTIAMSVYNLLVTRGQPMKADAICEELAKIQHPKLELAQVEEALAYLLGVKLAVDAGEGRCIVLDPWRRLIVARNLDDTVENADGTRSGGWTGWMRRERNGGLTPVKEIKR